MKGAVVVIGMVLCAWPVVSSAEGPAPRRSVVVVQPGETLSRIARRHGTTVDAIVELNGIDDPDRVFAGQKLRIPKTETPRRPSAEATTRSTETVGRPAADDVSPAQARRKVEKHVLKKHWVRRGETVSEIAHAYGVSTRVVLDTNGIRRPEAIQPGMVLWIPTNQTRAPRIKTVGDLRRLIAVDGKAATPAPRRAIRRPARATSQTRAAAKEDKRRLERPDRQTRFGAVLSL